MISIQLTSNAEQIVRQLGQFPAASLRGIARAMDLENELTVGHIQAAKLSQRGPLTLGVVTNRLRSSIRPSAAVVEVNAVSSSIGSNVAYAAAHEFGFDGQVQVRSFTRKNPRGNLFSAAATVSLKDGRISRAKAKVKQTAAGISIVRAHQRHMKLPERAFIRTGIEERAKAYGVSISAAIEGAWKNPEGAP